MINKKLEELATLAEKIQDAKHGKRGADSHVNSHQVIEEYQQWRAESEDLFQMYFDESNAQYKKFVSLPSDGNGYVLIGYFTQQYPIFKVLRKKIESGVVQELNKKVVSKKDEKLNLGDKTVFISHSGKDQKIANAFVDLILHGALNIPISKIFCISTEGAKIKSGEDWRNSIKDNLLSAKVNFLIITPNYKESEVCLNEMGAAWVTSAKVLPVIVEPINYRTVGVIQEPMQIEKLLDESSLDRLRDVVQKSLNLDASLIQSDRWTDKKKEFIAKVKEHLALNPFETPIDRNTLKDLQNENRTLNQTIDILIKEKTALETLLLDLEKIKDKKEVKKAIKSLRPSSDYENFKSIVEKITEQLSSLPAIIRGIIFKDLSEKSVSINWESYRDEIDSAFASDYIDEEFYVDWETTTEMRNLSSNFHELSEIMSSELDETFFSSYEEDFDAPFKFDNKQFWEEVFKVKIIF